LLNFVVDFAKKVRSILWMNPSQAEKFCSMYIRFFLRKMLGTRYGPVGTRFL